MCLVILSCHDRSYLQTLHNAIIPKRYRFYISMTTQPPSHDDDNTHGDESRENRIRRLIYRSSYTGTKETDKLLGGFSRDVLPLLTDHELDLYEDVLDFGDPAIWSWVSKQSDVPANIDNAVLTRLIDWCQARDPS